MNAAKAALKRPALRREAPSFSSSEALISSSTFAYNEARALRVGVSRGRARALRAQGPFVEEPVNEHNRAFSMVKTPGSKAFDAKAVDAIDVDGTNTEGSSLFSDASMQAAWA